MTVYVFLGPSMPVAAAQRLLDAVYLPPVAMGDLYTLVASRARAGDRIGIIDGIFEQVPAVWHKEILYALSCGVHVYGAASMGALRAAELHPFGMRGVGRIFEAFRTERLVSDDEVVVAHAQAAHGFRSVSDALVSIRFGLEELAASGLVAAPLAAELTQAAARAHYSERSWGLVMDEARARGADRDCLGAIRAKAAEPDAKAQDAAALLEVLKEDSASGNAPHVPNFAFQTTSFWTGMMQSLATRVEAARYGTGELAEEEGTVAGCFRAAGEDRDALLDAALLDRLVTESTRGFEPEAGDLQQAARRIARRHRLTSADQLAQWRRRQRLGEAEWRQRLALEARRHWLMGGLIDQLDPLIVARLKAEGRFAALSGRIEAGRGRIAKRAVGKPSLEDFGLSADLLQAWYEERFGPMSPDPASHARQLGFAGLRDFVDALLLCYLSEDGEDEDAESSAAPERLTSSAGVER
jgi:hypothetical protein